MYQGFWVISCNHQLAAIYQRTDKIITVGTWAWQRVWDLR